jgi:hypothetical protein
MFTPVLQGNIVTEGLDTFFDFSDPQCYLPSYGTTAYDLSGNGHNATLVGGATYRTTFGGCIELDGVDDNITYVSGYSQSFSCMTVVTSGTNANPTLGWSNDDGAFPGNRSGAADSFFILAVQAANGAQPSHLIPGLPGGTLNNPSLAQAPSGWTGWNTWLNGYAFRTNGTNSHASFLNNASKITSTVNGGRGVNGTVPGTTINIGRDPVLTRYATGRVLAYVMYNRVLSDDEIYQTWNYFGNKILTR